MIKFTHLIFFIFQVLNNSLWYVTNQHPVIRDASAHDGSVQCIPDIWDNFQGFNETKRKRMKEQPLSYDILTSHCETILSVVNRPVFCSPTLKGLKESMELLQQSFHTYCLYLKAKNVCMQKKHNLEQPCRQVDKDISIHCSKAGNVNERFRKLDNTMLSVGEWDPIMFDEELHLQKPFTDKWHRFSYFQNLQLSMDISILKYCPGGSNKTIV